MGVNLRDQKNSYSKYTNCIFIDFKNQIDILL